MSSDLLAEFGGFTLEEHIRQAPARTQSSLPKSKLQTASGLAEAPIRGASSQKLPDDESNPWGDDEDDFGDFEVPESDPNTQNSNQNIPVKESIKETNPPTKASGPPITAKKATSASQLASNHPFAAHADILFDADDYDEIADAEVAGSWGNEDGDDDDDFGDFETSETPAPSTAFGTTQKSSAPSVQHASSAKTAAQSAPSAPSATFDLLGLDDQPVVSSTPQPTPAARPAKNASPAPKPATKRPTKPSRQESTFSNDDAWDDFETSQPSQSSAQQQVSSSEASQFKLPLDLLGDLTAQPTATGVAPSNIPPPSVLLTIFPPVLSSLSQQFLHPLGTLSTAQKSFLLSSPEIESFLTSYITLTHVLAHVIAGRKSRWKRDKHLAQSMRIGPSMSGRSGGMKLTGLDRSEAGREDTEVEDALRVWREQVGRLKSAVAAAMPAGKLAVPELAGVMPVRVAKGSEGAIVSTQACALCGLKREERVAKVDMSVEDSFGEWWIEGTNMHTACARFWEMFKRRLNSR